MTSSIKERILDEQWRKPGLGYLLLTVGLCLIAFWSLRTPPTNYSLIAMAVAAGLMALRSDMSGRERSLWALLLILFAFTEIKAIKKDKAEYDQQQRESRQREERSFQAVVAGFESTTAQNNSDFAATMHQFGATANRIGKVAKIASESLAQSTGGDAYCYYFAVQPTPFMPPVDNGKWPLAVVNASMNIPLYEVEVFLTEVPTQAPGETPEEFMRRAAPEESFRVSLGTLHPETQGYHWTGLGIRPGVHYYIQTTTRTKTFSETYFLRLDPNSPDGYTEKYEVQQIGTPLISGQKPLKPLKICCEPGRK